MVRRARSARRTSGRDHHRRPGRARPAPGADRYRVSIRWRTPGAGILLYIYHTNAEGEYPTRGDETGNARRHGYLRGWVVTDAQGGYTVRTIKPGSYPGRDEPAHIHMTVKEPDRDEYWIDSVLFKGDPEITQRIRNRRTGRGGPGIIELEAQPDGSLRGRRDVILMSEDIDD